MSGTDARARAALASAPAEVRSSLPRVLAASDFVAESCTRDPGLLAALIERGDLTRPLTSTEL
ncbi:MAG TPA: hypothetical protein VM713_04955, partial [Steroidobacteraceae bacterium]|nr:hypothetical protein [Steroidobacteraceae bacterium]